MIRGCLALWIACAAAWASDGCSPVAVSMFSDGNLAVLCTGNMLALTDVRSGSMKMVYLSTKGKGIDIAAVGAMAQNEVYVATRGQSFSDSPVVRFVGGRPVESWLIADGFPTGIAVDAGRGALYISTLQSTSIYRLTLGAKAGKPQFLFQLGRAKRIGPLALDLRGDRIFVSDVFTGDVYPVTLAGKDAGDVVHGMGEPSAMFVGPAGRLLYVADRVHHCVWTVPVDARSPTPTMFWQGKDPVGVVVDQQQVWVADQGERSVVAVSLKGQQLRILR